MADTASLFPELDPPPERARAFDREPEMAGPWLAEVAVRGPVQRCFHYRIPGRLRHLAQVGARCAAMFSGRRVTGYIVGLPKETELSDRRLKALDDILDKEPVFNEEMLSLCQWIARYYAASLGDVLETALPKSVVREWKRKDDLRAETVLRRDPEVEEGKLGPASRKVLEALVTRPEGLSVEEILSATGVARGTLRRLVKSGKLVRAERRVELGAELEAKLTLTEEQEAAVASIKEDVDARRFAVTLLLGVTGSGKTEVYLQVIDHCLELGRSAIVLVPEIALTPQTTRRFRARFGEKIAVLHSRLSDRERWAAWHRVKDGEARVVIGPRSALFAPIQDLGLIVVDEEHETTYKQERAPRYQARDVAIMRARGLNAAVVLGSATPSLESFANARSERYKLLRLNHRTAGGVLPPVEIVDMAVEWSEVKGAPLISRRLAAVVRGSLERGERAILFLNRRGFTTYLHCTRCGYVHKCPFCDVALTFHKREQHVLCHFCAERAAVPAGPCSECNGPPLRHRGAGTERIEEACREVFPKALLERVDSDTVRMGDDVETRLGRFRRGEVNLLIGTQMIARGLDIPEVTAVGIVNADTSLGHPDFRATERTFQLIAQVAGRAGRGHLPGRTVVQTFNPAEPAIRSASRHDYDDFAERELSARELLGYPPYGRLLHILVRGENEEASAAEAERVVAYLRPQLGEDTRILGPAVSPRAYLANKFRFQALIKAPGPRAIQEAIARAQEFKPLRGVEVILDRDPGFLM